MKLQVLSYRVVTRMETYATERSHVHPITQSRLVSTLRGSTEKKMSNKLKDKIALITGGTEGIGLATAKLFAKEGAYVFITGRRQKELDEAVRAIGTNVSGVQGDVAQLADLDRLYETVFRVKGRIDIVFANAGAGEFVPFGAVTEEHFDRLFNINVKGTLFTVQKALPLMNDGGSIVINGSVASVKGTPAFGVYGATKAPSVPSCGPGPRISRIVIFVPT